MTQLVSQNDEKEILRKLAADRLDYAFRELFANMLRIARSHQGGAMHLLIQQFNFVAEALTEYQKTDMFFPAQAIHDALDFSNDAWWGRFRDGPRPDRFDDRPMEAVLRGAAQIMASRLLGQKTQEAAGGRELFEGLRKLEAGK